MLLALFERPGGELEVLLTTRAKTMRRQPSQTVCSDQAVSDTENLDG